MRTLEELLFSVHRVLRHLTAARTARHHLTVDQYRTLVALDNYAPLSLGQLAQAVRIDNPTMSRLVHELADRGFIDLVTFPNRKRISINLTPAGDQLCAGPLAEIETYLQGGTTVEMTPEERDCFHILLSNYLLGLDSMVERGDLKDNPLRATA